MAVKLTSGSAVAARESPAPLSVVNQLTTVPAAVLDRVRGGGTIPPLQTVKTAGPVLSIAAGPCMPGWIRKRPR